MADDIPLPPKLERRGPTLATINEIERILRKASGPISLNEVKRRMDAKSVQHHAVRMAVDHLIRLGCVAEGAKGVLWVPPSEGFTNRLRRTRLPTPALVRSHRREILRLAKRFGAQDVRVFGSVARGEADERSDLDILVRFEKGRSLLDQVGFKQALEDLLHVRVDLVSEGGISPYIRERVLAEAVPV